MNNTETPRKVFITGTSGFIGFHLAKVLLTKGFLVYGFDAVTDYYDIELKRKRNEILLKNDNFNFFENRLENFDFLSEVVKECSPNVIVHLAAQAGVRYSIDNPREYLNSNIVGSFNIMEVAKECKVDHLLMASTSSVYGANKEMPFHEIEKTETPLTFYAATKKANEAMAHSYANIWELPITMFRFFTVYGPWGRPDMALFKFTKGILEDSPIDIYNNGEMFRDFTYVEDLVQAISLLIDAVPPNCEARCNVSEKDSLSPVAPFRVVNIGNSEKVSLLHFIEALEGELQKKAIRNYMAMQIGDVPATWADAGLLKELTGYSPKTDIKAGIKNFVEWYRSYYKI